MGKDLFNYIVTPTEKEYRKINVIDDIYGIPRLIIPKSMIFIHPQDYLIDDAIVNYNNEIVVAKSFYASMIKYQKYYKKTKVDYYDFWSRKYAEQTIKELYSIYDKSMHILNYLYDLKIKPDLDFKNKVRNGIKIKDKKFYRKINSIYSRLYGDLEKNSVRDNITHNFSDMFYRYSPKYENGNPTGWYVEEPISYDEYKSLIDDICKLLSENKKCIIDKLSEIYPPEGSEKLRKKVIDDVNKLLGSDVHV